MVAFVDGQGLVVEVNRTRHGRHLIALVPRGAAAQTLRLIVKLHLKADHQGTAKPNTGLQTSLGHVFPKQIADNSLARSKDPVGITVTKCRPRPCLKRLIARARQAAEAKGRRKTKCLPPLTCSLARRAAKFNNNSRASARCWRMSSGRCRSRARGSQERSGTVRTTK